eukprot:Amastigsp_a842891_120.p2 type:complete len:146 gc:universal Amastigsp_a842891_120:518-81(-)
MRARRRAFTPELARRRAIAQWRSSERTSRRRASSTSRKRSTRRSSLLRLITHCSSLEQRCNQRPTAALSRSRAARSWTPPRSRSRTGPRVCTSTRNSLWRSWILSPSRSSSLTTPVRHQRPQPQSRSGSKSARSALRQRQVAPPP